MTRFIAITGTDTGAGKTVVTAALIAIMLRRGLRVDAVKLIATGVAPGSPGDDAELLARALHRDATECVAETFASARSPLAAATAEGRRVDIEELARFVRRRAEMGTADLLLIEGVGGLLVPLTETDSVRDLLRALRAPVLVVARAGLGTINHSVLTVEACRDAGLHVLGAVLSDVDGVDPEFAAENAAQIAGQAQVRVFGVLPHVERIEDVDAIAGAAEHTIDAASLIAACDEAAAAAPEHEHVLDVDRAHVWHPFTQTSEWRDEDALVIRSGRGCWLIDDRGERYLDGVGSLWANVHGHAHAALDAALRAQLADIAHTTFLGLTHQPGALLARELCAVAPPGLTRVFFSETGASAVEAALRIALLAQRYCGESKRTRFVSLDGAYHGDTAAAVSVGRSEPFHRGLDPLLFDALRVSPPHLVGEERSLTALRDLFSRLGDAVAAFVVEPRMQGAAGMWAHSDAWLRDAVAIARSHGALIICDEVATGFGRTGDLFASAGAGVTPDILALGKGLTGGYLPLSATLVTDAIFERFTAPYTDHRTLYYGHTYSANPLACAVARASLRLFTTERTMERARSLAQRFEEMLRDVASLPAVLEVRRSGTMVGIELGHAGGTPFDAAWRVGRRVTLAARKRNVVVRPLGDVVVLNPPLVMRDDEAELLVGAVGESITEVAALLPALVAV